MKKSLYLGFSLFFIVYQTEQIFAQPLRCDVSAPIAVLINADNGKVLFSKNGEVPCHPASTTKIATALYVLHKEALLLDQKVTASHDAISIVSPHERRNSGRHPSYRLEFGGTHMGIKKGEELDVQALLHGLMLSSGNDAANVLAEASSGSTSAFIEEMNVFLQEIGCKNTHLRNPHGMPDPLHSTTALDLALIAQTAMKNPIFKEIVSAKSFERPQTNKQASYFLTQGNALLKPGKFFYPPATGIKTGYTIKSGFVLVSSASKNGRNLIAVVMKCDEVAKRYRSTIALFDAAFQEVKQERKLLSKEHDLFFNKLEGAKQTVQAYLQEDLIASFYPSEQEEFHSEIKWKKPSLPIRKGEEVGYIQLLGQDENIIQIVPLIAKVDVSPTVSYVVRKKQREVFSYIKQKRVWSGYLFAGFLLGVPCWRLAKKRRRKGNK